VADGICFHAEWVPASRDGRSNGFGADIATT